jgi:hypothetical protein
MKANATGEQAVNVRTGVIKATSSEAGQTHGKAANCQLVPDLAFGTGQAVAAIHPHARPGIDQHIGDLRVG